VAMIAIAANQGDANITEVGLVALLLYRSSNYGSQLVSEHQRLAQVAPITDQLQDGLVKLQDARIDPGLVELNGVDEIELRDITFWYPNEPTAAVQAVSLKVSKGEVVGIVGPSGAGKSTLAELSVGLRHPTQGHVVLGSVDMADVADGARPRCVSLVSQSVPLIPDSVRANVRFFRDISDFDIDYAIEAAGMSIAVSEFPDGAQTVVGPGARSLSGGQTQRMGIARALAGRPSFIVFDEPTSALDAVAEQVITDTIARLRGSIGVIIIAHRLTTLQHCDRIVVIEDGRITDQGSFVEVGERSNYLKHALSAGRLD